MEQDRLARIEGTLARVDERLESLCERIEKREEKDDAVGRLLYGNNGTPGLVTQVELLKDAQARATWVSRAIIGAIVPLLAAAAWALLTK